MMAQRKLQQEIDRVFKRVNEGLQAFDYLYEKLTSSENPSQKDKLESDLKKEIKKLQRQREQIKNWLSGNEVKDKKQLLDYRKKIEKQMERFKIVERDMKTKAFSKEGLNMERKLDPREKEKLECSDFISETIDKLNQQNETLEAQIQQIRSSVKKNKKLPATKQQQIDSLEESMEKNNWHLSKLEIILRYLENGQVEPEQINEIKDSINYYIESNQDPDFYDDDTIYDTLGLDEVEPTFGTVGEFISANSDDEDNQDIGVSEHNSRSNSINSSTNNNNESNNSNIASGTNTPAVASVSANNIAGEPVHKNTQNNDQKINEVSDSVSKVSISASNKKQDVPRTNTPVERITTANDSSISSTNNTPISSTNTTSHNSTPSVLNNLRPAPIPKVSEVKYSALLHSHLDGKKDKEVPKGSAAVLAAGATASSSPVTPPAGVSKSPSFAASVMGGGAGTTSMAAALNGSTSNLPSRTGTPVLAAAHISNEANDVAEPKKEESVMTYLPGLDDLIPSFEQHRNEFDDLLHHQVEIVPVMQNAELQQYISNSLINCPDAVDSEKPFSYYPSKPHPTSIDYPTFEYGIDNSGDMKKDGVSAGSNNNNSGVNSQHNFCLVNAMNSEELFNKLSTETLFYIFYYGDDNGSNPNYQATSISMEKSQGKSVKEDSEMSSVFDFDNNDNGTYVQYCAFKELYNREWKFHKTMFGWFRRLENSASGVYQWFDTEVDWSVKNKELEGVDWNGDSWEVVA